MEAVVGKLVGKLGRKSWVQVYDFNPETEDKKISKGRLLAVVGLEFDKDTDQVEMVQVGREILSRLHEEYFGSEDRGGFVLLKTAVEKVEKEFSTVEMAAVVILGKYLYVVANNGAGVWVNSGTKRGWLITTQQKEKAVAMSGEMREKEVLILGNNKFWQDVPEGVAGVASETAGADMEAGVETLAAVEKGNEEAGGEAALIVRIQKSEIRIQELENREEENEGEEEIRVEERKERWWERVYVRHGDRDNQRKKMIYLGVVFLVMLLVMMVVGQVWNKQKEVKNGEFETKIERLVFDFNEAKGTAPMNPIRSRELLIDIKSRLGELVKIKDKRLDSIRTEFDQLWREASGIMTAETKEVIDLSLVRADSVGIRIELDGVRLVVLDEGGRILGVDIKSGSGKVVAGGEGLKGASLLATYPNRILAYTPAGIVESGGSAPVVKTDSEWGEIKDMGIFAGNIYLLDKGRGQIWRYNVTGSGTFGNKQAWLTDKGGDPELKQGIGMAIDGSIWVIKPGGIVKFTRGVKEAVNVAGLEQLWGESGVLIYTNDEADNLYVLDTGNKRIVILNKDGQYKKQLENDNLSAASDLVVDEKAGQIYIVGRTKVWSISI